MPDLVRCIHGFAVTSESGYCTACLISELQRQLAAANERADKFEAFFAGLVAFTKEHGIAYITWDADEEFLIRGETCDALDSANERVKELEAEIHCLVGKVNRKKGSPPERKREPDFHQRMP
jgi:hypothetical protein